MKERCVIPLILLFAAVILLVFSLVKGKLTFALMAVAIGAFGSCQELLQKPELAGHSDLLTVGAEVCVLAVAGLSVWFAAGRRQK